MFAELYIEFFLRLVIKFARRFGSNGWSAQNAIVLSSELKTSWTGCLLVIIHYRYRNAGNRFDGKFIQPFISRNYAEAYLLRYPGGSTFPVLIAQKFSLFTEQWQPKVIAEMNDYQFKIVKLEGDFIWPDHKDTDETFIVIEGNLRIDFRDGSVEISPGEMFVVPRGLEHKPFAEREVKLMLIEPRGVNNTGEKGGERTAPNDIWL